MIALGIDPGTATCGFGVVSLLDGRLRLLDAGVIRTPADETDASRLRQLHAALAALVSQHQPQRVGVERLFFQRNVQTARLPMERCSCCRPGAPRAGGCR